jgi:alkanesulfonate monooxygenase SsuD/methylene tetrahydromethanopterin reductase-like flavin-dependent oxidoreductase (luciferase family)
MLEFGLLLHTRNLIREAGPASFDDLWGQATRAEEAGFDHIWLGDSVTILSKARGDCVTTMSALAVKTSRIKIGAVPFVAALRNPVLLAHALATADVISGGRIVLGVSVAPTREYIERQFSACGVPFHEKAGRLSETIELMRRLWTEESFAYHGKYFHFDEIGVLPKPVQQPTIPIWIAADRNENAFKRVARLGDGWVTLISSLEKFKAGRAKIEAYAEGYSRSGQIPVTALYASFNLNRNGNAARSQGWEWMAEFFRQPRSRLEHHFTIFGTPDECADLLRGYVKAGLTTLIVRIASDDFEGQTKLLLEELKPRLATGVG